MSFSGCLHVPAYRLLSMLVGSCMQVIEKTVLVLCRLVRLTRSSFLVDVESHDEAGCYY